MINKYHIEEEQSIETWSTETTAYPLLVSKTSTKNEQLNS